MDRSGQKQLIEALILASPAPISAARLADIVPYVKPKKARELVDELNAEYREQGRGLEIWEVAGGYQLRTPAELAGWVRQLHKERPMRLSRAALETLSVIAYKQPATRAEVEQVRGVEVGAVVKSLLDRELVKIAGHREVPGRPLLYATTKRFLEVFGLTKLDDLPTLREIEELAPQIDAGADEAEASPAGAESDAAEPSLVAGESAGDPVETAEPAVH